MSNSTIAAALDTIQQVLQLNFGGESSLTITPEGMVIEYPAPAADTPTKVLKRNGAEVVQKLMGE